MRGCDMERLTFDGNFCDIAQCRELPCPHGGSCTQRKVWEKLKAYEELGFEPEEYKRSLNVDIIIPADKLEAIIETGCPSVSGYERCVHCFGTDGDCIACWHAWLKGGDTDG